MFFKNKNVVTEAEVLKALSQVMDPDLRKDIVSLGFVKNLKIHGTEIAFDVELTTPACPVKEQLKSECENKVKALPSVESVKVTMTANVRKTTMEGSRIPLPTVKNVIAIASGKGGVGKSTVTINLATALARSGARVGLLDADIYGPSIPLMLGVKEKPASQGNKLVPVESHGLKLMSMGFLVAENQPVIWRGPMVHTALTQFLTQVEWGELDYLLIDMPPGTGDAQLTISQNAPLSGAVIVTTPQEVSLLDARRGLMMFQSVNVPILGVIENMSGYRLPGSDTVVDLFGKGGGKKIADELRVPLIAAVPIDPQIVATGDSGTPIVAAFPQSEVAAVFDKASKDIAASLSMLQAKASGQFKSLSLQWQ